MDAMKRKEEGVGVIGRKVRGKMRGSKRRKGGGGGEERRRMGEGDRRGRRMGG